MTGDEVTVGGSRLGSPLFLEFRLVKILGALGLLCLSKNGHLRSIHISLFILNLARKKTAFAAHGIATDLEHLVVSSRLLIHLDCIGHSPATVLIECIHRVIIPNLWSGQVTLIPSLHFVLGCTAGEFGGKTPRIRLQIRSSFTRVPLQDYLVLGVLICTLLDPCIVRCLLQSTSSQVESSLRCIIVKGIDNFPLLCIFNWIIQCESFEE